MEKSEIYSEFQKLETNEEKAAFCKRMSGTTKHLNINWDGLADAWSGNKPWPGKTVQEPEEEDDETWAKSYVDPVGQVDQEKPLTQEELDALL